MFDERGRVMSEIGGQYEAVKDFVVKELTPTGRFFWIDGSMTPFPSEAEGDSDAGGFEITVTATQCSAEDWLAGGGPGQPVGRATWVLPTSQRFEIAPDDVWRLIREAALSSTPAPESRRDARGVASGSALRPGYEVMTLASSTDEGNSTRRFLRKGKAMLDSDLTGGAVKPRSPKVARMLASREPITVDVRLASGRHFSFRLLTVEQPVTCANFLEKATSGSFAGATPRPDGGAVLFGPLANDVDAMPTEPRRLPVLLGSVVAIQEDGEQVGGLFGVWTSSVGFDLVTAGRTEASGPLMFGVIKEGFDEILRLRPDDRVVEVHVQIPEKSRRTAVSGFDVWPAEECPTFAQIGGMQAVKDQLSATVGLLLTDPARAARLRISFNGVLLYGPLGTGKSLFARALAGEYGCNLVLALGGQIRDAATDAAKRLDDAFQVARSYAPSVLFFDEFDWLVTQADRRPLLDTLLDRLVRNLESVADNPNVIAVAATQAIDNVDPSFTRVGLFDLKIRVGLPDAPARSAILATQLRDRPTDASVDVSALSAVTEGLSAAALTALVNTAALKTLGRAKDGTAAITQADLLTAIRERGGRDRPALADWSWDALVLPADTKRELQELQRMIEDPGIAKRFGVIPPRGALLHGPPGTGKTTIARVLAAQAKTSFYPVKGSDIVSKWLGESEQRVHELFTRARENRPSIVFLDEIDAIGAARGSTGDTGAMDRILNQLLQEIDGLESGSGVFVLGATNRAELLDEALLRGGRLGRHLLIPNPDREGRVALLKRFTVSMPLSNDFDVERLAARTEGMSGADLQQVCQQAAVHAMMQSSSDTAQVSADHFEAALQKLTR